MKLSLTVTASPAAALDGLDGRIAAALQRFAEEMVETAADALSTVVPSRPGTPPADPSGALTRSLFAEIEADGALRVGSDHPAAAWLEYGTRKMSARPFLEPALISLRPRLSALLTTALRHDFSQGAQQ